MASLTKDELRNEVRMSRGYDDEDEDESLESSSSSTSISSKDDLRSYVASSRGQTISSNSEVSAPKEEDTSKEYYAVQQNGETQLYEKKSSTMPTQNSGVQAGSHSGASTPDEALAQVKAKSGKADAVKSDNKNVVDLANQYAQTQKPNASIMANLDESNPNNPNYGQGTAEKSKGESDLDEQIAILEKDITGAKSVYESDNSSPPEVKAKMSAEIVKKEEKLKELKALKDKMYTNAEESTGVDMAKDVADKDFIKENKADSDKIIEDNERAKRETTSETVQEDIDALNKANQEKWDYVTSTHEATRRGNNEELEQVLEYTTDKDADEDKTTADFEEAGRLEAFRDELARREELQSNIDNMPTDELRTKQLELEDEQREANKGRYTDTLKQIYNVGNAYRTGDFSNVSDYKRPDYSNDWRMYANELTERYLENYSNLSINDKNMLDVLTGYGQGEGMLQLYKNNKGTPEYEEAMEYLRNKGYTDEQITNFIDYRKRELNTLTAEMYQQSLADDYNKSAWGHMSAPIKQIAGDITSALGFIPQQISNAVNSNKIEKTGASYLGADVNSAWYVPNQLSEAEGSLATEGLSKTQAMVYSTVVSGIESRLMSIVPGGNVILGLSASSQTFYDLKKQGINDTDALEMAIASGIAEGLFESISISQLKAFREADLSAVVKAIAKNGEFKELIDIVGKNILKSTVTNFSEEFNTEVANMVAEYIILGENSDYSKSIQQYMADGMSLKDATDKARVDSVKRSLEAGGSGALMGAFFGLTGTLSAYKKSLARYTNDLKGATQLGADIKAEGSLDNLLNAVEISPSDTEQKKIYNEISERASEEGVDITDTITDAEIGRLAQETKEYIQSEESSGETVTNPEGKEVSADLMVANASDNLFATKNGGQQISKAVTTESGEATEIAKVDSAKNDGTVIFELKNGEKVDSTELNVSDAGQRTMNKLLTDLASSGYDSTALNSVMNYYNAEDGLSIREYASEVKKNLVYGSADLKSAGVKLNTALTPAKANALQKIGTQLAEMKATATANSNANIQENAVESVADATARVNNNILSGKAKNYVGAGVTLNGNKVTKATLKGLNTKNAHTISVANIISRATGLNFQFVESYEGKTESGEVARGIMVDGKFTPINNGMTNLSNGVVMVDLNSGSRGEGLGTYTLAHEVGHAIKEWSADGFNTLANYVTNAYSKGGVSIEELIENKRANGYATMVDANGNTVEATDEYILEEVVCDALEEMFNDDKNTVLNHLQELNKTDKNLFNRIKDAITRFADKIEAEYKKLRGDSLSDEAKALKGVVDDLTELRKLFAEAINEAGQNIKKSQAQSLDDITDTKAKEIYKAKEDIIKNQLRYVTEGNHWKELEKKYSKENSNMSYEQLKNNYQFVIDMWENLSKTINSEFLNQWNNQSENKKDRAFTVFKKQMGYKYNIELSQMCSKGVSVFEAIDTIVKKKAIDSLKSKTLGIDEKKVLYDVLQKAGFQIPCSICYVEQARQTENTTIDAFINGKADIKIKKGEIINKKKLGWNEALDIIKADMKKSGVDIEFDRFGRDIATDNYSMKPAMAMDEKTSEAYFKALVKLTNEYVDIYNNDPDHKTVKNKISMDSTPKDIDKAIGGNSGENLAVCKLLWSNPELRMYIDDDLLYSSYTIKNLSMSHPDLATLVNKQGGVNTYKAKERAVAYMGDLLGTKYNPKEVRRSGGIRNQSNSDFQLYTLLDQAQLYVDMTAKGYYLHSYTKVIEAIKLFGLSKGKINASAIPKVVEFKNSDGSINEELTVKYAGLGYIENGKLNEKKTIEYMARANKGDLNALKKLTPIYDDVEGINHEEAFAVVNDPEYSKNVTVICIGYSDEHIKKLLDEPRVQLIIGFHDKSNDREKRYKGAKYADNYNGRNEAKDGTTTVHVAFNDYIEIAERMFKSGISDFSTTDISRLLDELENDDIKYDGELSGTIKFNGNEYSINSDKDGNGGLPKLGADIYLADMRARGLKPAYDIEGIVDHPNYYKLLADFGLKNINGEYAPHEKVQFNMPKSVPCLDTKTGKTTMVDSEEYIFERLKKELNVMDDLANKLADESSNGIIPKFINEANKVYDEKIDSSIRNPITQKFNNITPEIKNQYRGNVDEQYEEAYYDGDYDKMYELIEQEAFANGYKYKAFHHTNNGFNVFDLDKARKTSDIQGFYFSESPDAESEYGDIRYDVFLKMKNPFIVDSYEKDKQIPLDLSKTNSGVDARRWLISNGYDGVIRKAEYMGNSADEYIVLNSNQIKSAEAEVYDDYDELIPPSMRFDSSEDDIRYSIRKDIDKYKNSEQIKLDAKRIEADYQKDLELIKNLPEYKQRTAEEVALTKKLRQYEISQVKYLFNKYNSNQDIGKLADKVFEKYPDIAKNELITSGIKFKNTNSDLEIDELYSVKTGAGAITRHDDLSIVFFDDLIDQADEQKRANILLHEVIHACTVKAIRQGELYYNEHIDNGGTNSNFVISDSWDDVVKAGASIIAIYNDFESYEHSKSYGFTSPYEMVAEMSNSDFREELKSKSLWGRFVDAIKKLFGIKSTVFDYVDTALNSILDEKINYDKFANELTNIVDVKHQQRGIPSVDSDGNELSQAQQEFFKDSKVVDENGKLLKVYHGTVDPYGIGEHFTEFKLGYGESSHPSKVASFFTDSKELSDYYRKWNDEEHSSSYTYVGYLNLTNPLVVDCGGKAWNKIAPPSYMADYIRNNYASDKGLSDKEILAKYDTDTESISRYAKAEGYDGVIFKNIKDGDPKTMSSSNVYAMFESNQFKNVDNTNPTTDPDIRYQQRENLSVTDDENFTNFTNYIHEHLNTDIIGKGTSVNVFEGYEQYDFVRRILDARLEDGNWNKKAEIENEFKAFLSKFDDWSSYKDIYDAYKFAFTYGIINDRNPYGMMSFAMSNSIDFINDIRKKLIAKDKKKAKKVQEKSGISPMEKGKVYEANEVRDIFFKLNSVDELNPLAEKVFDVAEKLGVKYKTDARFNDSSGRAWGERVRFKFGYMADANVSDQQKAETILHESIHTATTYFLWRPIVEENGRYFFEAGYYGDQTHYTYLEAREISKDMNDAIMSIKKAYNQCYYDTSGLFKGNFSGKVYGLKDYYEFVAELSNPTFREKLAKINVLEVVVNAIKRLFGIKVTTAYDSTSKALEYMLEHYDVELSKETDEASRLLHDNSAWKFQQRAKAVVNSDDAETIRQLTKANGDLTKAKKLAEAQHKKDLKYIENLKRLLSIQGKTSQFTKSSLDNIARELFKFQYGDKVKIAKENLNEVSSALEEFYAWMGDRIASGNLSEDEIFSRAIDKAKINIGEIIAPTMGMGDDLEKELEYDISRYDIGDLVVKMFANADPVVTMADKTERKLLEKDLIHGVELKELRDKNKLKIDKLHQMYRDKLNNQRIAQKEFYERKAREERIRRNQVKQNARDKRDIKILKDSINKTYYNLAKDLLNPREGHYVPESIRTEVASLLSQFDLTKEDKVWKSGKHEGEKYQSIINRNALFNDTFRKIGEILKNNEDVIVDSGIIELFNKLDEKINHYRIEDMTKEQLEVVDKGLKLVNKVVRGEVKDAFSNKVYSAYQIAKDLVAETSSVKGTHAGAIDEYLTNLNRSQAFFNRLGGYKPNSKWMMLYDKLNNAQRKKMAIELDGTALFNDLIQRKDKVMDSEGNMVSTAKALKDLRTKMVDIGLGDEQGNIQISRGMLMSVYMHLMNEDNIRHIIYNSFTVPDAKAYYSGNVEAFHTKSRDAYGVAEKLAEVDNRIKSLQNKIGADEEISNLYEEREQILLEEESRWNGLRDKIWNEMLTDYEKEWIERGRYFFDTWSADLLNEASMDMYGFEKAVIENYFPIHTDSTSRGVSYDSVVFNYSLENMGMMQDRQSGTNRLLLEDYMEVILGQIKNVANYSALAPAIKDFNMVTGMRLASDTSSTDADGNKVLNARATTVTKAISKKFGKVGLGYLDKLMSDLQGASRREPHWFTKLLGKTRGNMAQAVLSMNLRVTLSQSASYPTAMAELDTKSLAKALISGGKHAGLNYFGADKELIRKYTPLLDYRLKGYSSEEIASQRKSNMARFNDTMLERTAGIMNWIQQMDGATVGRLWYACEYYIQDHNKNLEVGTDAYYYAVAEKFNKVVENTQPNYAVMQRPELLRNTDSLIKSMSMYMTQRLQNFNILYDSINEYRSRSYDYKNGLNEITKKDVIESKDRMVRAIASQVSANMTLVAMRLGTDALLHNLKPYKDDDDELTWESVLKRCGLYFVESFSSCFFFGSELYSVITSIITGDTYYGLDVQGISALTDATNDMVKLFQTLGDDDGFNWDNDSDRKKFINASANFLLALGVPVQSLKKYYNCVDGWVEDIKNEGKFYDDSRNSVFSTERQAKKHYQKQAIRSKLDGNTADYNDYQERADGIALASTTDASLLKECVKEMYLSGEVDSNRAVELLKDKFSEEEANKTVNTWENPEEKSASSVVSLYLDAYLKGDTSKMVEYSKKIDWYTSSNSGLNSAINKYVKEHLLDGSITEEEAMDIYLDNYKFGDSVKDEWTEAEKKVNKILNGD